MKTYPLSGEKWVRALRYPFVNVQRDFFSRIFNMELAPDGQKVPYTTNVCPSTIKVIESGVMERGLAPPGGAAQLHPIKTYDVECETQCGVYKQEGRIPLLAIGSNSSDEQLNRKFKDTQYRNDVLIVPAWLHNYSVVYVPLVAPYGSIPASVYPTPGVSCQVTIGFFSLEQAQDIVGTEGPYDVRRLHDAATLDSGDDFHDALAFVSAHGILSLDGESLLRIKEVPHKGNNVDEYRALSQVEVLREVMKVLDVDMPVEDYLLSLINSDEKRVETDRLLKRKYGISFTERKNATIILPGKADTGDVYKRY